tara:strand:+ start:69 stop:638 length:570 start_codon:yes stop_codon:yes gene_type:complete
MSIKIIDDVVPKEMFELIAEHFSKGIWDFTNRSEDNDLNTSFSANDYCNQINALIKNNELNKSNIVYNLWVNINEKLQIEKNYKNKLKRVWLNGGPPLYDQKIHCDSHDTFSKDLTIVCFIHPYWNTTWGGELLIYDVNQTRVINGVFPLPNRVIMFPSYLPHRAVSVSRISSRMRVSIAFQCKYDYNL